MFNMLCKDRQAALPGAEGIRRQQNQFFYLSCVGIKKYELAAMCEKYSYSEIFWSVFSHIRTEFEDLLCKSPYSVGMLENTNQKNWNFSRSALPLSWKPLGSTKMVLKVSY